MSDDSRHLLLSSCYRTSSRLECCKIDAIASLYLQLTNFYSANTFKTKGTTENVVQAFRPIFQQALTSPPSNRSHPPGLVCLITLTDPQKELVSPC